MNTPKQIAEMFERYIALVNMPDEPQRLYAPIRYSLAEGGKRMRPVLAMLAYNIYADDIQRVLPAAVAIEVFHNFNPKFFAFRCCVAFTDKCHNTFVKTNVTKCNCSITALKQWIDWFVWCKTRNSTVLPVNW